jgi:GNAT superfamily N-acetyltransferase
MEDRMTEVQIDFASEGELRWIEQNDTYISRQTIEKKLKDREYIVARHKDRLAGYIRFGYFWSMIPYIEIISVEDQFKLQGIGRAMVNFLEDLARAKGQKLIMSSSQADEPQAQAFHRKVGFRDAGALVDLLPLQSVTEVVFVKTIDDGAA